MYIQLSVPLRAPFIGLWALVPTQAAPTVGWEELGTKLPKAISDHTACRSGNVVYLAGGCDAELGNTWDENERAFVCLSLSRSFYGFTIGPNVTTMLADMPVPRYRHAAVGVNNQVWLVGGRDANDTIVDQVDVRFVCLCVRA